MKAKRGFTLLEMSVVIVIIGLIVGSVIVGVSVKRAAEVRGALAEYDRYLKAIGEFKDKYYALPGDMNNATSMWGTDPGGCPGTTNTTPRTGTCNGDGNGHIGDSDTSGVLTNTQEWYRAWQQLGDSGFIDGHFSGTLGPLAYSQGQLGLNVPQSTLSGAGWTLFFLLNTSTNVLWGDQYGHMLGIGAPRQSALYNYNVNNPVLDPIMTPAEAEGIDQKIDDGKPGRGKVRALRTASTSNSNCTSNDTTQDLQAYNTTYKDYACSLLFILGF